MQPRTAAINSLAISYLAFNQQSVTVWRTELVVPSAFMCQTQRPTAERFSGNFRFTLQTPPEHTDISGWHNNNSHPDIRAICIRAHRVHRVHLSARFTSPSFPDRPTTVPDVEQRIKMRVFFAAYYTGLVKCSRANDPSFAPARP